MDKIEAMWEEFNILKDDTADIPPTKEINQIYDHDDDNANEQNIQVDINTA